MHLILIICIESTASFYSLLSYSHCHHLMLLLLSRLTVVMYDFNPWYLNISRPKQIVWRLQIKSWSTNVFSWLALYISWQMSLWCVLKCLIGNISIMVSFDIEQPTTHYLTSRWASLLKHTVYPKKYAHGFVVLCFVVVMQSFIMNSHEVFIHIHQGCFAGTGVIVRLPQCQWSKPDGYGKISQCITTTKHSKAKTVCIFLVIYCIYVCFKPLYQRRH